MSKQIKAIIAVGCTSGLSLIVWMICAVLYFTDGQDVATSIAIQPGGNEGEMLFDAVATETDAATASRQSTTSASPNPQAKAPVLLTETKTVDQTVVLERPSEAVPIENKLDAKFPFSVFEKPITAITVDPSNRRILLVGIQEKSLSIMGMDQIGQEKSHIQSINVDGTPVAVALKKWQDQTLYIVATTSPPRLLLIDSESLKVVRRVHLNAFQPQRLWDHLDATSPLIVIGKNAEKFELKFDPKRGLVRGISNAVEFDIESMSVTRASHGAVWDVTPSGHCLFTLDRSPMIFGPFPHQTKTSPIQADSIGDKPLANQVPTLVDDMVVIGRSLFRTQAVSEQIGVMEFRVLSNMAGTTLLAGTIGQTFRVGRKDDMETLFVLDLPDQWKFDSANRSSYEPRGTFVVADAVSDTFVLACNDRIATFALSEMGIKVPADLSLVAKFPNASVGELLSVPIRGRSELKTLKLEKGPDGLTLQANEVRWTPTINQLGDHEIAIRHISGDESVVSNFVVSVERSGLDLAFEVQSILDSPTDGPSLVIGNRQNTQRKWEPMIASVDLKRKTILASKQTPEQASYLIGDRYGYRVSPGFEIFDRKTLESIETQPGVQPFTVPERTLTQWKKLESLLDDFETNKQQIESELRQPSLQDAVGWKNPRWNWGTKQASFGETGFGEIRNGILYDPITEKPRLLIWPAYTRTTLSSGSNQDRPGVGFWHPFPSRVSNLNRLDQAISQGAHPFAPELLKGKVENDEVTLTSSTFSGEIASTLVIQRLQKQVGYNAPQNKRVFVSASADLVRVGYDGRLYLIDRKEFPPPAPPFHIVPMQSAFVAAPGQAITLKYQAPGARRFSLRIKENKTPIALRSDDGVFTFELDPNVDALVEPFVRAVASRRQPIEERRKLLQNAIEANQMFFKHVVGRESSGVAISIQVLVDAQRQDLKTTGFFHDVLYEIPSEIVVEALERDHQTYEELKRKANK